MKNTLIVQRFPPRTPIATSGGALIPLAQIDYSGRGNSINVINHENTQRRIVVSANIQGRHLGSTVKEMQYAVSSSMQLPQRYFVEWRGQVESKQSASRLIQLLRRISQHGSMTI